jgi:protein O-mannosyl-transferase
MTSPSRRAWLIAGALVALALASSVVGIGNGFAYDDRYIVLLDARVHSLTNWTRFFTESYWPKQWGPDGYRPLTLLAFGVQWAAAGGQPWVFHAVNVALYAATTLAVFALARTCLPLPAAWLAAALFAVHPVHVEAVANVVGQAELWVGLLLVGAAARYVRRRNDGRLSAADMAAIGAAYVLACLFKEHAIVFPALLALAELTVVQDARSVRQRIALMRPFALVLALLGVSYLGVRTLALSGEITGFHPYIVFESLSLSSTDRILTMFGIVPTWVRLLVWPARLSADYSPPGVAVADGLAAWQLPGFVLLCASLWLAFVLVRRRPALTFGIAWVAIVLLPSSNFLVPSGILLAERTLFLPSVGIVVALAGATAWGWRAVPHAWVSRVGVAALALAIVAGAWRSHQRTRVWRDNATLFAQTVKDAPRSYRAHYLLGATRLLEGNTEAATTSYQRALQLFPYDALMTYNMAEQLQRDRQCAPAIALYEWTYRLRPDYGSGHLGFARCLLAEGRLSDARRHAYEALRHGNSRSSVREILSSADSLSLALRRRGLTPAAGAGSQGPVGKVPGTMQNTKAFTPEKVPLPNRKSGDGSMIR